MSYKQLRKLVKKIVFGHGDHDETHGFYIPSQQQYEGLIDDLTKNVEQLIADEVAKVMLSTLNNIKADVNNGDRYNTVNGSSLNDISSVQVNSYCDYWLNEYKQQEVADGK